MAVEHREDRRFFTQCHADAVGRIELVLKPAVRVVFTSGYTPEPAKPAMRV
jgi:hypothetical protein